MSFIPALTSDQLNTLRGTALVAPDYEGAAYASVLPNTIVFRALVNQASFAASYASVVFDTVSVGAYTDIVDGMRVFITPTTDLTNALRTGFTGRARADNSGVVATSTVLNVNESSTEISDNWVITVIDDYPLLDRLGRQVDTTQYIDYDISFRLPKPVIYNIRELYADWVTGGVYTIDFTPLAFAVTSGASISSWQWDVIDGSITVGSDTSQNITVEFPPGFRWVFLTVTDSNGSTRTRRIPVFAHDPDTYPPVPLQIGDLSVQGSVETGYNGSMTAWAGVSSILDNTLMGFWSVEKYQDYNGSLLGDNVNFVGRFRKSNDSSTPDLDVGQIAETCYTIEGAMTQLARIEMLPYELTNVGTATAYFQVVNLTAWRAVCLMLSEFSTFLETHSLSFDSLANTFTALGFRTQNGNILAVVNDLYYSINGAMQMNPSGQAQFVRDLRMGSTSARNAAPTVINFDNRDLLSIDDYSHDNVRTVGRLKASGGTYLSAVNQYATFESLAPGIAQDYPEGSTSLDRQVLQADQSAASAQDEINVRAGYALARAQNSDKITVTHPDGYNSIVVPTLDTWYTFTLDGSETVRGIVLTSATRWLCISVEIEHNGQEGEKVVHATYTIETTGAAGQSVVYPPSDDSPYTDPSFPPFDAFPAFPTDPSFYLPPDINVLPFVGNPITNQTVTPNDGNTAVIVDTENNVVKITTNFITGGKYPTWVDITPPNALGQYVTHAVFVTGSTKLYALYNDGVNSTFAYCANPFAAPPVWLETAVNDVFITIEPGDTAGKVTIYGNGQSSGNCADAWVIDTGTEISRTGSTITASSVFTGGNNRISLSPSGYPPATPPASLSRVLDINVISGPPITGLVSYMLTGGSYPADIVTAFYTGQCIWYIDLPNATGAYTAVFTFSDDAGCGDCTPIGTSAITRYSTNYGATFAASENAGETPSLGAGIDSIKIGTVALVGSVGQTLKSTSGSSWSPYGTQFPSGAQPNGIVIPRYQFGGTVTGNVSTSTPQYLAASGTLSTGNEALWKVTTSGSLFTDITPHYGGYPGLLAGTLGGGVTMPYNSGKIILELAKYNGTARFSVTVNTGANWKFSQPLNANANYVRTRKSDLQNKQAFMTNGSYMYFCSDYQAATLTLNPKYHNGGLIRSIEIYG